LAYNRNQAKAILTTAEYELFTLSLADRTAAMDAAELKRAIGRARRARDKYQDLFQRQATASAEAGEARGAAIGRNDRTRQKAALFGESLQRLTAALDKEERREARALRAERLAKAAKAADGGPAGGATNRAQRRAAARTGAATDFVTDAAKSTANQAKVSGPTSKNISAHRAATTRRSQAKRDAR
jgi:hypothetical protein